MYLEERGKERVCIKILVKRVVNVHTLLYTVPNNLVKSQFVKFAKVSNIMWP